MSGRSLLRLHDDECAKPYMVRVPFPCSPGKSPCGPPLRIPGSCMCHAQRIHCSSSCVLLLLWATLKGKCPDDASREKMCRIVDHRCDCECHCYRCPDSCVSLLCVHDVVFFTWCWCIRLSCLSRLSPSPSEPRCPSLGRLSCCSSCLPF